MDPTYALCVYAADQMLAKKHQSHQEEIEH
jgi:hypothetical protein